MRIRDLWISGLLGMLLASSAAAANSSQKAETRCGWFGNPTPANAWLNDRDGEWTVGIQGGHQADGDWPDFKPNQWVETNAHYGYGCACLKLVANPETREVERIISAKARPLAACRNDKALKKGPG